MGSSQRLLKTLKEVGLEDTESLTRFRDANKRAMWAKGSLKHMTRPNGQRWMYEQAHREMQRMSLKGKRELRPLIWLCHRRLGKSFLLLLLCIEKAISQPGAQIKYACATRSQVQEIIEPMLGLILSEMPRNVLFRKKDIRIYFRQPDWPPHLESRITLVGLDYKAGDLLRGPACDLAALDEARDIGVLEYCMTNVLAAQFIGRPCPIVIMASTPPESMEHPFISRYYEEAIRSRTAMVIPASKNPDWTLDDELLVTKQVGGKGSLSYQREIECELKGDPSRMVIPEIHECKDYVFTNEPIPYPDYYRPYVGLDTGWKDHLGCSFGFLDFMKQKLCFVGEIFQPYLTTPQAADMIHEKYEELFDERNRTDGIWRADAQLTIIETLRREYRCPFMPADKSKAEASLAAYRGNLMEGKILIDAHACPQMVRQHLYGVYNRKRTDFERTDGMGHLDLIKSNVYLHKGVKWRDNPIPRTARLQRDKSYGFEGVPRKIGGRTESTITKLFGSYKRRR